LSGGTGELKGMEKKYAKSHPLTPASGGIKTPL